MKTIYQIETIEELIEMLKIPPDRRELPQLTGYLEAAPDGTLTLQGDENFRFHCTVANYLIALSGNVVGLEIRSRSLLTIKCPEA